MRLALVALVVAAMPSAASAACTTHLSRETAQGYTSALLKRLRPLGASDINFVEPTASGAHYAVLGAQFSLFLKSDGAAVKEVGLVLSEPVTRGEAYKLLTATTFTLARLSGSPEATIGSKLASDSADHSSGSWNETFGPAAAVFTRSEGGTVVKVGLLSCD